MPVAIDNGTYWEVREKISNQTPLFHDLVKARKWLPMNNYHRYVRRGRCPEFEVPGQGIVKYDPYQNDFVLALLTGSHQGPGGTHQIFGLDEWHTHINDALARKVRDPEFHSGIAFGEFRETGRLFSDAARRVARATRQARRGNFVEAYQSLTRGYVPRRARLSTYRRSRREVEADRTGFVSDAKDLANNHLAYVYGVTPLMNDVEDAIKLLDNVYSDKPPPTKSGFVQRRHESVLSASPYKWNNIQGKLTLRGGVYYEVSDYEWFLLQEVGLANLSTVVWELIPYSFVVDWFVNVGDWLLSQQEPRGLTYLGGWSSVFAQGTASLGSILPWDPARADCDGWLYDRRSITGWPRIELRLKADPFGGWLNHDHQRRIIDAMALVTASLTR